eukprot:6782655-Karenia_brevis.AAC.1
MLSFTSAISAYQKGKQWQHVAKLLNEMRQGAQMLSLNTAISAARKVISGSVGRGCSMTFNGVLDAQLQRSHPACEKGGQLQHVAQLLNEMQQGDKCAASTQASQHARKADSGSMRHSCSMKCDKALKCSASTQPSQHARGEYNDSMWRSCSMRCDRV